MLVRLPVTAGSSVTVIGDGAVGLLAVLSAKRLGAEQILLMGRQKARTDLGLQAVGAVRHGGTISRVGVPQYEEAPVGMGSLFRGNVRP
jgi:threonine dehydrogenase-like Zn-dependent dehydrogenase